MTASERDENRAAVACRLLSEDEVRRVDAAAEAAGVSGAALMAAAGKGVGEQAERRFAGREGEALVLAGPGKNGGDGYVAALALSEAGRAARVLALGDPEKLAGDAGEAMRAWREAGGAIEPLPATPGGFQNAAYVIDALFGVGLSRPLSGAAAAWAEALSKPAAPPVVSVDLPSGVLADSGRVAGPAFQAALTVTFVAPKRAHLLDAGARLSGDLAVVDIGAPAEATQAALEASADPVALVEPALWTGDLLKRDVLAHKYGHGHAVVVAGGFGATGAARLAARAALRIGAGLATVAAPDEALPECAAQLTAVMLRRVDRAENLTALLQDPRLNAVTLGPGHASHIGGSARTARFATALLEGEGYRLGERAAVLDADALTAWPTDAERTRLFAMLAQGRAALTPHMGEFRALFPDLAEGLAAPVEPGAPVFGKIEATREAAARAGAVVLLKGADTVIAAPDGRAAVHGAFRERAAPELATAGAGDVLAGLICGLAARGWDLFEAACAGAWLHAETARLVGPGLIAEDLPDWLPEAILRATRTEEGDAGGE